MQTDQSNQSNLANAWNAPLSFPSFAEILKYLGNFFTWHPVTIPKLIISRFTMTMRSTRDAANVFRKVWDKELLTEQEQVYVLFVDSRRRPIKYKCLFTGGRSESVVDNKIVLSYALKYKAHGLFIAHNHPSGILEASSEDLEITSKLNAMCETMEVELYDHIILTENDYFSFAESGLLK